MLTLLFELYDGGPPTAVPDGGVTEPGYMGVGRQLSADLVFQPAPSFAVNHPQTRKVSLNSVVDEIADQLRYLLRKESVEIENVGDDNGFW